MHICKWKEAEHETYRNMYNYMVEHPELMTKDNAQGLEWAKKQNYAFLMESSSIQYIIERHCDVTQVGDLLDEKGYGIAMRKGECQLCSFILRVTFMPFLFTCCWMRVIVE